METDRVKLTASEVLFAAMVGASRQVQNLKLRRSNRFGASDGGGWERHVEGALGELALAKALGLYWAGSVGNLKAGDVGKLQVRTTARKSGRLILHPSDADTDVFFLVVGRNGSYRIRGWILGGEGKSKEFWVDPTGKGRYAYFVPQWRLRTFSSYGADTVALRSTGPEE